MSAKRERPENPELMAAIIAHPDEDTPRLMYADWLQENGDEARAEFIRLHIEWDRRPPYAPPNEGLKRRLIAAWEAAGLNERWRIYERGFNSVGVYENLDEFCEHVPWESQYHPLRFLYTSQSKPLAGDPDWRNRFLAAVPYMRGVTGLGANDCNWLLGECGEEYLRLPQAANLRVLDLGTASSAYHCQLLAEATHVANLLVLDMNEGCETTPRCLELIAGAPHLRSLVALRLGCFLTEDSCVGADELRLLLDSPHLINLRQLGFDNQDRFDDAALRELLNWDHIGQLEVLELAWTGVTAEGLRALAKCRKLSRLRRLSVRVSREDGDGITELLESPHLSHLKELYVAPRPTAAFSAALSERLRDLGRLGHAVYTDAPPDPMPVCVEDRIRGRFRARDYFRDGAGLPHPEDAIL